jgi:hypothetical protein
MPQRCRISTQRPAPVLRRPAIESTVRQSADVSGDCM